MFQNLRRALYQLPVFFFLCTAVTLSQTGCADSKAEPVSSKTSKFEVDNGQQPASVARPKLPLAHLVPTATQQSDSSSKDGSAAQTGPDGDRRLSNVEAKALLFDVRGLRQKFRQTEFSAQGLTREQAVQLFTPMLEDIVNKSDQIVAAKADSKTRLAAADLKIFALRKLGAYTQKDANHDIKTFCRKLQNDRNDRVARFGERTLFVLALENTLREEKPDVATHHKKLARIIKANRNIPNDVGTLISEIMSLLVNNGFTGEAGEFALIIAAELKNSQDEQLVETAHVWESRAPAMILEPKLQAVLEDKEGAVAELQQWIKDTITSKPTDNATFKLVTQALQILEITGNYEIALESYTSVGEAFKDHEDADLAASVATKVARAERRLGLVGKPFEVSGVLTDGKPFEWAPYKGKVVLVDFWVVGFQDWHLQRLPEIKAAYERYKEKGFEVVGVNLNVNRRQVDEFLKFEPLPWPTVVSPNDDEQGPDNPLAVQCGLDNLPFNVLINQDGIVVGIRVFGSELEKRLKELTTESQSKPPEPDESPKEPTPTPKNDTDSSSSLDREQDQVAFLAALDDTASATLCDDEAEETEESESPEEPKKPDPPLNPYTAPRGISAAQLVNYLLNMSEKPHTIQERPGFGEAAVEAAERLITEQKKGTYWRIGVISKFKFLHKMAAADHEESEKKLAKFADQMKDSTDKRIAKEVRFLALERKAIDAEKLEMKAIEPLLAELKAFFQKQRLNERHMRIASMTVRTINQLDSEDEKEKEKLGDLREKYLKEFGELFAKSSYRKLAAYGNTIAKKPSGPVQGSDLVGKPLELAGDTASGMAFDWKAYRGKVVIVDFWATWCGPCVREMPNVKAFYEKHKKQGFDIVGVSLDRQLDALTKFIEEQKIPWANLAGDDAKELAQKYGVRAIPMMMLVDREGKVVAVANRIETLKAEVKKLLAAKDEKEKPAAEKPAE